MPNVGRESRDLGSADLLILVGGKPKELQEPQQATVPRVKAQSL